MPKGKPHFQNLPLKFINEIFNTTFKAFLNYRVHTGLPTKDENIQTTVRNLYRPFFYTYGSLQL